MAHPDDERIPLHELGAAQAAANAVFWLDAEWASATWAHGDNAVRLDADYGPEDAEQDRYDEWHAEHFGDGDGDADES